MYFYFISESDLESLELFRDKNLLILGSEENQMEQNNICQAENPQELALIKSLIVHPSTNESKSPKENFYVTSLFK